MFDLEDDFDLNEEEIDQIFTGKTLEKSSKFSSINESDRPEEKKPEGKESTKDPFWDDDDELILSVIEPDRSPERIEPELAESENIPSSSNIPEAETSSSHQKDRTLPSEKEIRTTAWLPQSQCNRRNSSVPFSPIVCQRKFPGPAGLLPRRNSNIFSDSCASPLTELDFDDCASLQKSVCSQNSTVSFESGPWQQLVKDFKNTRKEDCFFTNFTVSWVKRKALAKHFVKNRVPFLAAVLTSLDCSAVDKVSGPVVILKDPTGEIHGTLHRDAWDQFGELLAIGSVLILRHVGVYSAGVSTRQQYLNISVKNISVIYPSDSSAKVELFPVKTQEVVSKINEWKNITLNSSKSSSSKSTIQNDVPRSLFNSKPPIGPRKSSPSLGEPLTKRPCHDSSMFPKSNVPSPFPVTTCKSTNQNSPMPSRSIDLNSKPNQGNSKVTNHLNPNRNIGLSNSISSGSRDLNPRLSAGESIDVKSAASNISREAVPMKVTDPLSENKTAVNSTSNINNEDMTVLTSVLEGIDADMFDDF